MLILLTVYGEEGGWGGSLAGRIRRHAAVVCGVRQPGLQDQEVTGGADDEVRLGAGVDGDGVAEPADHPGGRVAAGRVAPQLRLPPNFDLGRVRRSLEILAQV